MGPISGNQVGPIPGNQVGPIGGNRAPYLAKLRQDPYFGHVYKVVLIDHGTRSGKELAAAIIKHDGLATLVGSRTAGAFLGGSPVRLFRNRYLVEVAIGHYVPPGIGEIEGVGVPPDVAVSPCIRFCRGRDPQLAAALQLVRRHLPGSDGGFSEAVPRARLMEPSH